MPSKVYSAAVVGVEAFEVEIEVHAGTPKSLTAILCIDPASDVPLRARVNGRQFSQLLFARDLAPFVRFDNCGYAELPPRRPSSEDTLEIASKYLAECTKKLEPICQS